HLRLSFHAPRGWHVRRLGKPSPARLALLAPGGRFTVAFRVRAPTSGPPITLSVLSGAASYGPPGGARSLGATLGEQVSVPVASPFATANVTGKPAWFGASHGVLAIGARGTGVFPSYEGAP